MKIAIIGFGGVGKALAKLIPMQKSLLQTEHLSIQVLYIVDYYGGIYAKDGIALDKLLNFIDTDKNIAHFEGGGETITVDDIVSDGEIDLAVIMTPTNKETGQPGLLYTENLLKSGKHVVLSDKGPIMLDYAGLSEIASQQKVQLGIGCTTGGALPSINGGLMDLAGSKITSIEGILNGTTNFILKYMEEHHCAYTDALQYAKEAGIAETNPSLDVEGWDTAGKLLILTNVLMNQKKKLADIAVEGITHLTYADIERAHAESCKYKLIGSAILSDTEIQMQVKLRRIPTNHLLYSVEGKNKAIRFCTETLGELVMIGGASGVIPAAASILRDIVNIHRGYNFHPICPSDT